MSRFGDAFQDWLDGGKDSEENQADRASADDAADPPPEED